jgi:hypothetical protein
MCGPRRFGLGSTESRPMTSVLCQGFCVRVGNAPPSDACQTVAPASTSWPWCPSCTRSTLPCLLPPQPLPQLQVTARSCSPWKPSRRCSTWLSWGPERLLPRRPELPAPDRGPRSRFASSYASRGSVLTRLRLRSAFDPSGCAKCTDAGAVFGAATRPRPRVAPGQPVPTATGRSVGAAQPPRVLRPAARGLWTPHLDLTGQSAQTLDQPAGTPTKGPRAVFQPPI